MSEAAAGSILLKPNFRSAFTPNDLPERSGLCKRYCSVGLSVTSPSQLQEMTLDQDAAILGYLAHKFDNVLSNNLKKTQNIQTLLFDGNIT
ncbi:hypothetical protein HUJ04_003047 [Dendroctonus ponderosae]|nr:hypothetical protein HUJ04_003047 [Dendroctonus ponderosae]KAH1023942.1 hypothetical protein HUJ05_003516 [Dendroctonus ponderosae]